MNLNKGKLIILGAVLLVVMFFVLGFLGIIPGIFKNSGPTDPNLPTTATTLEFWGVGGGQNDFDDVIKAYQQSVPKAKINYTKFDSVEIYEKELVNALAEKRGPDVFMIHSSWVYKHKAKLYSTYPELISTNLFKQNFPQVVLDDFIYEGKIFASPLYLDSLALIYNKDIFNSKAVIYPPKTLDELVSAVSTIKDVDSNKNIKLSALALGGAKNINNLGDVLSALAFQGGAKMKESYMSGGYGFSVDDGFSKALKFYLQFSSSYNPYYTWNETYENSLSSFASGKTAMIIDYYEAIKKIKEKNPFINLAFSSLPQLNISNPVNVANYWGVAVSNQTKTPYLSWHFVRSLTLSPSINSLYLKRADKLPAILSLINSGLSSDNGIFLKSFLVAKTWVKPDNFAVEKIFKNMIADILSGRLTEENALRSAQTDINNLY